jgi:hypothetical protein
MKFKIWILRVLFGKSKACKMLRSTPKPRFTPEQLRGILR